MDFTGNLSVVRPDGSTVWTHALDQPVYVTPIVANLTGDESLDLAVHTGNRTSEVVCFHGDGEIAWRTEQEHVSLTWSLVHPDAEPGIVTTDGDELVLLDGRRGAEQWRQPIGEHLAVGDADGTRVYATARDGAVRAVTLADGDVSWTEQITEADSRINAPTIGAVSDGNTPTVVAGAYDGTLAVCDGESGDLLARRQFESGLYTPPMTTDLSSDGTDDVVVMYGDTRIAALSYEPTDK